MLTAIIICIAQGTAYAAAIFLIVFAILILIRISVIMIQAIRKDGGEKKK